MRDREVPSLSIGYWLRRTVEGRGYAGEAAALLTDCAFRHLHAQRVAMECEARNTRSAAIVVRIGYLLEGNPRHHSLAAAGRPCDAQVYAMIPADFRPVRGKRKQVKFPFGKFDLLITLAAEKSS